MKKPSGNTASIARSASLVSIAVMCSRILGLVREQVLAALFGAGFAYDSFVVAFRVPNLLRDLFGEGALSAAFVTVFSEYDATKGREETWRLANNVFCAIAILLSAITLVAIYFSGAIVTLIAPHFDTVANKIDLTQKLTIIMMPFLICVSLSAVVMGILNTKGKFFISAMASSFFNIGSIVGGVGLALLLPKFGQPAIVGMAIGTLVGGLLQFGGQLPLLFKIGYRFKPQLNLFDPGLKKIFMLMVPAVIGLGATQINIFVNTNFASSCVEGSVSWLNYSFRLVQFPIGVFGVAISIAAMPVLAKCAARKDMQGLRETYTSSLTMALCLTVPATFGMYHLGKPIIRIIFEHGLFSSFDTVKTAEALSFYVLGLFAYACVKITVPVFYALNDTKIPVIGSFIAVCANIILIVMTIESMQHRAIALSTSFAMIINFLFLSVVLYRKMEGYALGYLCKGGVKIVSASLVMTGWVIFWRNWLDPWMQEGLINDLSGLVFLIGSSACLYGVVLYSFKLKELNTLVEKVCHRF